jgi:phage terminase small subunit
MTPKQEAFAVAYVETGNASEAYRRAYDASRTKPDVVHVKASQLLADGRVAVRVKELQAKAAEKAGITLESHLADLQRLRDIAQQRGQLAAAIGAEIARGKAAGVHIERTAVEVTHADDDDARAAALADRLERSAAPVTRH